MGKKRKTTSPLLKDKGKTPRAADQESMDENVEEISSSGEDAVISDLKEFIRKENARNSKAFAEEMRRYNDERVTALENSLSFALTTTESLAKRLKEVEGQAQQMGYDLSQLNKRLVEVEGQLDLAQQKELQNWLIFSGPAVSRAPRSGRGEETANLLFNMVRRLMEYELDLSQVAEIYRDERQIQVRFSTASAGSDRHFLVRNKTRLRGSGLYIRERLTPSKQRIFETVMQLKRKGMVRTVFTKGGEVFVIVDQERPRPLRSGEAVERLSRFLTERTADSQTGLPAQELEAPPMPTQTAASVNGGAAVAAATGSTPRSGVLAASPHLCSPSGDDGDPEYDQGKSVDRAGTAEDGPTGPGPVQTVGVEPETSSRAVTPHMRADRLQPTSGDDIEVAGSTAIEDSTSQRSHGLMTGRTSP